MSQLLKLEEEEVHYVFDNSELVLDSSEINEDIIYSDGTQAILVNGHIIQGDSQTIVLQEGDDLAQYYVDENNEQILITEENEDAMEENSVVQYIEQDDCNGEQQVVYISNSDQLILNDVIETDNLENDEYEVNQLELNGEVVDFDDIMQQENQGGSTIVDENGFLLNGYHYAVLKDGKLHLKTYTPEEQQEVDPLLNTMDVNETDLSKITGKNLLTGQTVTLHKYLDKIHRKNTEIKSWSRKKTDLNNLLNKKLPLCKTSDGKRLIGKVIHVEKRLVDIEASEGNTGEMQTNVCETETEQVQLPPQTVVEERKVSTKKVCKVDPEDQEHISRTLAGIMTMETVKKKLLDKTIVIRLLEKKHIKENKSRKRVSYSVGHMEQQQNEMENEEKWVYVQHADENEVILYEHSVNISIQMTIELNGERKVKVILNDENFQTPGQEKHSCQECGKHFSNPQSLKRHMQNNKLKCETCFQRFGHELAFKKHMATHVKSFQCEVCMKKFVGFAEYNQHKKVHSNDSCFECFTCGKSFSRYSNLMRHVEIHRGGEALYTCDICGSSYNYISSLTRHIVQNHI
ncbi:unnamed protein product [Brassicogethes aeneus]|uniref:C2H2-type domain-containing protein n=1 Tax=Brassicogethes aeneus TaxID=1431903 RepID=A0A9P0AW31_BRAAE|nr:unnamed protein product [Brassicogethes aeneus]